MVGVWAKAWPCAKYANNYIKKTAGPERVKCKKKGGNLDEIVMKKPLG